MNFNEQIQIVAYPMASTILFNSAAVDCMRRMSALFKDAEPQGYFSNVSSTVAHQLKKQLKNYEPLDTPEFNTRREKRLAQLVYLNIMRRYSNGIHYIAADVDVVEACNTLLAELIDRAFFLSSLDQMQSMIEAYPINLLCEICHVSFEQVSLLGEGMKHFIKFRTFAHTRLPRAFQDVLYTNVPVIGDAKSPLTQIELQALFRYLGTHKRIYVEILLGCLFELGRHEKEMNFEALEEADIIRVYRSAWFYLLCFSIPHLHAPAIKEVAKQPEQSSEIFDSPFDIFSITDMDKIRKEIDLIESTIALLQTPRT